MWQQVVRKCKKPLSRVGLRREVFLVVCHQKNKQGKVRGVTVLGAKLQKTRGFGHKKTSVVCRKQTKGSKNKETKGKKNITAAEKKGRAWQNKRRFTTRKNDFGYPAEKK